MLRALRDRLAHLSVPAPLKALPLLALPIASMVAVIDLLGVDEVRYAAAAPDDDEETWVVARTDGVLPGGCQITAQVLDAGAPADVRLRLVRAAADGAADVWTATTNQNGAHRFSNLVPGTYHLAAFADDEDRAPAAAPVFVCSGDGARVFTTMTMPAHDAVLSGTVTSSLNTQGGPRAVPGAEIALQQEADEKNALAGVLRVPVNADGRFTVRLAPGRYVAQLMAPHHAPQIRKITIGQDENAHALTARLVPAPHVDGVLVDEDGAPLANALIALAGGLDPKAKQTRVRTDAAGRFSLPVRMGQDVVVTARAGARTARAQLGVVQQATGLAGVRVVAEAGRAVQGQVTRPDGSAVAYSEVRFRVRELGLTGTERADADGRFLLEGMPSDADVEVWAEGNATGAWGAQVASPGSDQLALVYIAPAY